MVTVEEAKTPRSLFSELGKVLAAEPSRTAGVTALYQFDISGDQGGYWYVDIVEGKAEVGEGQVNNPGCTITMRDADYVALATKQVSGALAFMTGKLRVKGDAVL